MSGVARSLTRPVNDVSFAPRQRGEGGAQRRMRGVAIALAVALLPVIASACPVCFGNPGAPMTKGTNNGILFLLGIIGFVQLGFVAMFFAFWRRARALRAHRESFRIIDGGLFR